MKNKIIAIDKNHLQELIAQDKKTTEKISS